MLDQNIINNLRNNCTIFQQRCGSRTSARQEFNNFSKKLTDARDKHKAIEEAILVIQDTAKDSQKKIKLQLSSLVTQALQTIYPEENCIFDLKFVPERGQTSVYPVLFVDGNELDPLANSGGMGEVISFALRIALIAIGKKDKLLILDEPFTGVSEVRLPLVHEFIHKMGEDFDMQFIITTHLPGLTSNADKSFYVSKESGCSVVRVG